MSSSEVDQLLTGAFHTVMDKTKTDILQTENEYSYIENTFL